MFTNKHLFITRAPVPYRILHEVYTRTGYDSHYVGLIKKDVMSSANSTAKLLRIDPMDTKSHAAYSRVDLGFAALEELSKLKSKCG